MHEHTHTHTHTYAPTHGLYEWGSVYHKDNIPVELSRPSYRIRFYERSNFVIGVIACMAHSAHYEREARGCTQRGRSLPWIIALSCALIALARSICSAREEPRTTGLPVAKVSANALNWSRSRVMHLRSPLTSSFMMMRSLWAIGRASGRTARE